MSWLVESRIRMIKERVRSLRHTLPFKIIPKLMIVEMVKYVIKWINMFPTKGGLVNRSPRMIMVVRSMDYNLQCRIPFGSYVQVVKETDRTLKSRTTGEISMCPDESHQCGFYFISLNTGRRIHRRQWTRLPMPEEVIKRVEYLSTTLQ